MERPADTTPVTVSDEDYLEWLRTTPSLDAWSDPQAIHVLTGFFPNKELWLEITADLEGLGLGKHIFRIEQAIKQHRTLLQLEAAPPANDAVETPETKPLSASVVSFAELVQLKTPERKLYMDWLKERSLVMVYGPRGVGKTMNLLAFSISLATKRKFLKWEVHQAVGVLYVDGEMTLADLEERIVSLTGESIPHNLFLLPSELVYMNSGRDLTLTREEDRGEIEAILDARPDVKVLVLDNISCLFPGISEDKKQDWEPVNAWFIRLRHRGITVIAGHHAGKGGLQRGTSGREDSLDTIISLRYPDGYQSEEGCHFHLHFEKSRGIKGDAIEALDVRLEDMAGEGPQWTCNTLEASRTARVKAMLLDSVPVRDIAEELGVSRSYVHRIKRLTCGL
jgi:putative DNA primase/helicase